jgi:transcriptional regulator with XRE-family HTH domain
MTVLLREAIGDRLRRTRTDQKLTLREVSRAARVSLGYLSEIERGRKEASSELLASICEALRLPLADLLHRVASDVGQPPVPALRTPLNTGRIDRATVERLAAERFAADRAAARMPVPQPVVWEGGRLLPAGAVQPVGLRLAMAARPRPVASPAGPPVAGPTRPEQPVAAVRGLTGESGRRSGEHGLGGRVAPERAIGELDVEGLEGVGADLSGHADLDGGKDPAGLELAEGTAPRGTAPRGAAIVVAA